MSDDADLDLRYVVTSDREGVIEPGTRNYGDAVALARHRAWQGQPQRERTCVEEWRRGAGGRMAKQRTRWRSDSEGGFR